LNGISWSAAGEMTVPIARPHSLQLMFSGEAIRNTPNQASFASRYSTSKSGAKPDQFSHKSRSATAAVPSVILKAKEVTNRRSLFAARYRIIWQG
jgi:hypothetical protein